MTQKEYLQAHLDSTISPMDFLMEQKSKPDSSYIIDVRNAPPELKKEKIKGSVEIPLGTLSERLGELPKDKTIIVYCWDVWCNMAKKASEILLNNGFIVKELSGGISAWNSLNLPTEKL